MAEDSRQNRADFNSLECEFYTAPGNLAVHAQQLLSQMNSPDEMEVLQAVTQFSMHLAMAPEDAFSALPIDQAMAALVECLNKPLPDVSLYGLISLNHILDTVPNSTGVLAALGGVSALCAKLVNFDYIDMAEHTITALERLAYDHSTAILKEGAFAMLINMIEFFEATTQKRILSIAVVVARGVQNLDLVLDHVLPALPVLSSYLQFRGPEFLPMNALGLAFFHALADSVKRLCAGDLCAMRNNIEVIAENGVFQNVVELIPDAKEHRGAVFRLLRVLCACSPAITLNFHHLGASSVVQDALTEQTTGNDTDTCFMEVLSFVEAILPVRQPESESELQFACIYTDNPEIIRSMGEIILPRILVLYEQIVNKSIRHLVLQIMDSILAYSEPDVVASYASPPSFSTFLSELLSCKDSESVRNALSIVFVVLSKIPERVVLNFTREGVIDKVKFLEDLENAKSLSFPSTGPQDSLSISSSIRQLLYHSGIPRDSPLLEHIIRQLKRKRSHHTQSGPEDSEELTGPALARSQSEPPEIPDILTQAAQEISSLSFAITAKYLQCSQCHYDRVLQELRSIAISLSTDHSDLSIRQLASALVAEETVSLHELTNSGVLDALWKWLTAPGLVSKRVCEFLQVFSQCMASGESYYEVFVKLLIQGIRYTQQLIVLIYESADLSHSLFLAMKTLANRVKISLKYSPEYYSALASSVQVPPEIELKHSIFSECPSITLVLEKYQTLDYIYDGLLKATCKEHIEGFVASYERTSAEVRESNQGQLNMVRQHMKMQSVLSESLNLEATLEELGVRTEGNEQLLKEIQAQKQQLAIERIMQEQWDPEGDEEPEDLDQPIQAVNFQRKESLVELERIEVVFTVNGARLDKRTTFFEILNKHSKESEELLVLSFHFALREHSTDTSRFLSPNELLANLVAASSNIPVPPIDKVHSLLRISKLFYLLNKDLSALPFNLPEPCNPLPAQIFICNKLSALLSKQLSDMLAMVGGMFPDWVRDLPRDSPFLFPFALRHSLFRAVGFSNGRALYFYSDRGKNFSVKMLRQKAMVPREQVLEMGMRILSDTALLKFGMLEFDFAEEEGTGVGPTLEFYSLVSEEVRKLGIWRNTGERNGLFPAPVQTQNTIELERLFKFIGKLVAKALYDDKMVDLPLSKTFWKLVFRRPVSLADVLDVDYELGKHLLELYEVAHKHTAALSERRRSQHTLKGVAIVDLALTFTLPGYEVELKPNGQDTVVTGDTLEEYITLVAHYTLLQNLQAEAFRNGFEKLIPISAVELFLLEEIEQVVCGKNNENWDLEVLGEALVPDHGFSKSSETFQSLLLLMTRLNEEEKRNFLKFVTGSPRLPIGGFKELHPPLTVVRKQPLDYPDAFLPSVMTCQNYLKVPDYSSYEILENKMKYAITAAHESFHLS